MTKRFLLISCVFGAAAVILGAFGAHVLGKILSEADLKTYQTGVQYHFYHTFALLGTAIIARNVDKKWSNIAGWLFTFGIIFFSGSLYLLSLAQSFEFESIKPILGPITPLGGVFFIGGWMSLMFAGTKYKERNKIRVKGKSSNAETF
ncbi:MAG: DUF423 domain-containing protein [Bacteroidota bacterium]